MLYMLHLSWTPCICAGDPCLLRVHVGHRREDAGDQRVHPLDRWELDFYLNAGVWYKSQQVCELGTSCSCCTKLSPGPLFLVHCWRIAIYGKIFFRLISTSVHILHLTLLLFREDTKFPPRNLPDFRDGDDDRVSDNDRDGPELLLQRPSAYRGSSVGSQVRIESILDVIKYPALILKEKHCQRHSRPEGWVLVTKVKSLGHITSSQTNLDQISSSRSRPSSNFNPSTKYQQFN